MKDKTKDKGKEKDSSKCKEWERRRREKLNDAFKSLSELLPNHDPAKNIAKIDILEKSTEFVKELRLSNSRLVSQKAETDEKCKLIKELHDEVNKLILRVKQLTILLKQANIPIPIGPAIKSLGKKRLKWSFLAPEDSENNKSVNLIEKSPRKSSASPATNSTTSTTTTNNTNANAVTSITLQPLKETNITTTIGQPTFVNGFITNSQANVNFEPSKSSMVQLPLQTIFLTSCQMTPVVSQPSQIVTRVTMGPSRILPKPSNGPTPLNKIPILPIRKPLPPKEIRRRKRKKKPIIITSESETQTKNSEIAVETIAPSQAAMSIDENDSTESVMTFISGEEGDPPIASEILTSEGEGNQGHGTVRMSEIEPKNSLIDAEKSTLVVNKDAADVLPVSEHKSIESSTTVQDLDRNPEMDNILTDVDAPVVVQEIEIAAETEKMDVQETDVIVTINTGVADKLSENTTEVLIKGNENSDFAMEIEIQPQAEVDNSIKTPSSPAISKKHNNNETLQIEKESEIRNGQFSVQQKTTEQEITSRGTLEEIHTSSQPETIDLEPISTPNSEANSSIVDTISGDKISECIARSIDLIDAPDGELMELAENWAEADHSSKSPISPTQMFLSMFPLLPRESIVTVSESGHSKGHAVVKSSFFIDSMLPEDSSTTTSNLTNIGEKVHINLQPVNVSTSTSLMPLPTTTIMTQVTASCPSSSSKVVPLKDLELYNAPQSLTTSSASSTSVITTTATVTNPANYQRSRSRAPYEGPGHHKPGTSSGKSTNFNISFLPAAKEKEPIFAEFGNVATISETPMSWIDNVFRDHSRGRNISLDCRTGESPLDSGALPISNNPHEDFIHSEFSNLFSSNFTQHQFQRHPQYLENTNATQLTSFNIPEACTESMFHTSSHFQTPRPFPSKSNERVPDTFSYSVESSVRPVSNEPSKVLPQKSSSSSSNANINTATSKNQLFRPPVGNLNPVPSYQNVPTRTTNPKPQVSNRQSSIKQFRSETLKQNEPSRVTGTGQINYPKTQPNQPPATQNNLQRQESYALSGSLQIPQSNTPLRQPQYQNSQPIPTQKHVEDISSKNCTHPLSSLSQKSSTSSSEKGKSQGKSHVKESSSKRHLSNQTRKHQQNTTTERASSSAVVFSNQHPQHRSPMVNTSHRQNGPTLPPLATPFPEFSPIHCNPQYTSYNPNYISETHPSLQLQSHHHQQPQPQPPMQVAPPHQLLRESMVPPPQNHSNINASHRKNNRPPPFYLQDVQSHSESFNYPQPETIPSTNPNNPIINSCNNLVKSHHGPTSNPQAPTSTVGTITSHYFPSSMPLQPPQSIPRSPSSNCLNNYSHQAQQTSNNSLLVNRPHQQRHNSNQSEENSIAHSSSTNNLNHNQNQHQPQLSNQPQTKSKPSSQQQQQQQQHNHPLLYPNEERSRNVMNSSIMSGSGSSRPVNWMTDTPYRNNNKSNTPTGPQGIAVANPFSVSKLVGTTSGANTNSIGTSNGSGSTTSGTMHNHGSSVGACDSNSNTNYCAEALIRKNTGWNNFNFGSTPPNPPNLEHRHQHPPSSSNCPAPYQALPNDNFNFAGYNPNNPAQNQSYSNATTVSNHNSVSTGGGQPGTFSHFNHSSLPGPGVSSAHLQVHHHQYQYPHLNPHNQHLNHQHHQQGTTSSVSNFNLSSIFPEINDKRVNNSNNGGPNTSNNNLGTTGNNNNGSSGSNIPSCGGYYPGHKQ